MIRKKIIVFGATKCITQAIKDKIRPENCEIVAFVDNNKDKQGLYYEGVPIFAPLRLTTVEFDYVVIGALPYYEEINNQLLKLGIPAKKILPLLYVKSVIYTAGRLKHISKDILRLVFRDDTDSLVERVEESIALFDYYSQMPYRQDYKDAQLSPYRLIAHAGGGWLGNNKEMYTNSVEAFSTSLEKGFKVFEFDVWGECGDDLIFAHDAECYSAFTNENYTPLTFKKMVSMVDDRNDLRMIFDIKYHNIKEYASVLKKIEGLSTKLNWNERAHKQLIIEVYDRETALQAKKSGWHSWLTSYRNPDGDWFLKSVCICDETDIRTMMLPVETILERKQYFNIMADKGIGVVAYSTDDVDDYCELKRLGCKGILTNYLKPIAWGDKG
ncbi:MAG: hypothetical protein J6H31_14975 [Butyrivibrio sp.]|nr:hypothetical protein [Butyrivibrio sp.]